MMDFDDEDVKWYDGEMAFHFIPSIVPHVT